MKKLILLFVIMLSFVIKLDFVCAKEDPIYNGCTYRDSHGSYLLKFSSQPEEIIYLNYSTYIVPINNATKSSDDTVAQGYSPVAAKPFKNAKNGWDYINQEGAGCPPYLHLYYDNNSLIYVGYVSDEENLSNASITLKADVVEAKEDGDKIVPDKDIKSCSYRGSVEDNERPLVVFINETDKSISSTANEYEFPYDEFINKEKTETGCMTNVFVCASGVTTYAFFSKEDAFEYFGVDDEFEIGPDVSCNELSYDGDNYVGVLTDGCPPYNNIIYKYGLDGVRLKSYCSQALSYLDYSAEPNSCIQKCLNLGEVLSNETLNNNGKCGLSEKLTIWIANIVRWVKYIVPVLVIVLGILDFIRAMASDKDDEMKKAQGRFIKRLIAAALIFIAPFIIEFVLNKMGFASNGCGIIDL